MIFDTLVWDRTEADADRAAYLCQLGDSMSAAERAEFNAGLKGAYNAADWNRVESAVATLAAPLELSLTTKTNWTASDVWTEADEQRYISNLLAVTEVFLESDKIPGTMADLTVEDANSIEAAVWMSASGLLWATDGPVYAADGLLRITKMEAK